MPETVSYQLASVPHATYDEGVNAAHFVVKQIKAGKKIYISLAGMPGCDSKFLYGFVNEISESVPFKAITDSISFTHATKFDTNRIKDCFISYQKVFHKMPSDL